MSHAEAYDRAAAVTPSDATVQHYEAFSVGVAGNVAIVDRYGTTTTIPAIAGEVYPIRVTKILSTGTTATGIVGYN